MTSKGGTEIQPSTSAFCDAIETLERFVNDAEVAQPPELDSLRRFLISQVLEDPENGLWQSSVTVKHRLTALCQKDTRLSAMCSDALENQPEATQMTFALVFGAGRTPKAEPLTLL